MVEIRDIRADLQVRLELLEQRKRDEERRHAEALDEIDEEAEKVEAMLELESGFIMEARRKATTAKALRPGAGSPLESEILGILSNGKEWEHAEIKGELVQRGLGKADDENFGRVLQGTLLSMRGRELLELPNPRSWRITKKGLNGS